MLPIEDTPPADAHEISLTGVDLSNPALDDHNPIPKFSIRDYVFSYRSKDIKTNWPFSHKSLQLCLNHGVKNLLPPFQCLGCVKKRFGEKDVKSILSENRDEEPFNPRNDHVCSSSNKVGNIGFSRLESEKPIPFTTNNHRPQEVAFKTIKNTKLHWPKEPEISKNPSMKKFKLITKVGTNVKTSSMMVELMASSKICPICKTFSSSSNNTLNAHIDRCLSMDSPIEPSTKSMVIKHIIKPRKTRSMVDIYAKAVHCTLDELDQRNGRIWSEKTIFLPIQETSVDCGGEKRQRASFEEKGDEDDVYIDANGTKLRNLNKISDTSLVSNLVVNRCRLSESLKGGKGSKSLSSYKKKLKHCKYLKLASQREEQCPYKTRLSSRVLVYQEKDLSFEETPKTDESMDKNMAQSSNTREQIKAHDYENTMPKWASSKRTDLLKRRFEIDQSSLNDSYLERRYVEKVGSCYESPFVFPNKSNEMNNSSYESHLNEIDQTFSLKDIKGSSSREPTLSVDQSSLCQPKLSKKCIFRAQNVKNHEYSEKHLEHQLRIDEESSQLPLETSNIMKIKKKKLQAITEDVFINKEQPRRGKIVIGQSSSPDSGNLTSLAKYFVQNLDTDMERETGPTYSQENYFSGVDRIRIPGPPGSFLPSPGRMSSNEDHQGNSSVITSQVQSSLYHFDTVDIDSSNSPKSGKSTVSNTLANKSVLKSTENLFFDPRVLQDEIIELGFSDEITKSTLGFQELHPCCSRNEAISVNNQEFSDQSRPDGYPSPSSPNPVLRLMGKNLMVANNAENLNSKFHFGSHDHVVHQVNPFSHGYKYKPNLAGLPTDLNRSRNIPFSPPIYVKIDRTETTLDEIRTNEESQILEHRKEIIVDDHITENEYRRSGGYYNSRHLHPFYSSEGCEFLAYKGPHMIPNVSSQMHPLEGSLTSFSSSNRAILSLYYPPSMYFS